MKSMCKSSLGLFSFVITAVMLMSSVSQAIFIRGNGGIVINDTRGWMTYDSYEWLTNTAKPANYSKQSLVYEKVIDYVFGLPPTYSPLKAFDILNSVAVNDCTLDDYTMANTDYTFVSAMGDLENTVIAENPKFSIGLAAINFFNPEDGSYRICKATYYNRLNDDQKAVLLFHEIVYILLEKTFQNPPTPEQVRTVVIQTLRARQLAPEQQ